jgi:nucleoside-diphosphate-sugar epimerase
LKEHFPSLKYEIVERDAFRPQRGTLSIKKAKELIGYVPEYDLRRGVNEYVDFVKKHHPYYEKTD